MFFMGIYIKKFMYMDKNHIQSLIKNYPDFPKQGILFRDITPVFKDNQSLTFMGEYFYERFKTSHINYVAGIEARGLILSTVLGLKFNHRCNYGKKSRKIAGQYSKTNI